MAGRRFEEQFETVAWQVRMAKARAVGCKSCTTCPLDEPHHFMIDCDDDFPEGRLVCRHCPATRELTADDIDRYA